MWTQKIFLIYGTFSYLFLTIVDSLVYLKIIHHHHHCCHDQVWLKGHCVAEQLTNSILMSRLCANVLNLYKWSSSSINDTVSPIFFYINLFFFCLMQNIVGWQRKDSWFLWRVHALSTFFTWQWVSDLSTGVLPVWWCLTQCHSFILYT